MEQNNPIVACSLTEPELRDRRSDVLGKVGQKVVEVKEMESGYAFRFDAVNGLISELANLIDLERRCCPFLEFRLTVEPSDGPVWLELTGPPGTKDFLVSFFE